MAEQKKTRNQIHFRLTAEEATKIELNAATVRLSPSAYAKKQALEGKVKSPVITRDIGESIFSELGKIGSNINQIARKLNMDDEVLASEFREVKAELDNLWSYVTEGKKIKKSQEKSRQEEVVTKKVDEVLFEDVSKTKQSEEKPKQKEVAIKQVDEELFEDVQKTEQPKKQETPICEYCKTPMEKNRAIAGTNMGRWYWHCPNYKDDDGIHKTNEYIWVK